MVHTPVCELLDIRVPVVQACMSTYTSAELVAAVTNAGGLGSLGAANRPLEDLQRELARIGDLTGGPFAVNHAITALDEDAFQATLDAHPKVVTLALDRPDDCVARIHDAGALVMHQVTTVEQAEAAVAAGVDIIIAQGSEAGGYGGVVSTMPLVPQVVDAVRPVPVIAAGGITDGRGLAAALMLGAQGVNVGTRFLATRESPIVDSCKHAILGAAAQDAVRAEVWNDIAPGMGTSGYRTVIRALRTPFLDKWSARRDEVLREMPRIREELANAAASGRFHDLMIFGGQSAGAIDDLPSAADVVARIAAEAAAALRDAGRFLR